jgi:hypothetical protein
VVLGPRIPRVAGQRWAAVRQRRYTRSCKAGVTHRVGLQAEGERGERNAQRSAGGNRRGSSTRGHGGQRSTTNCEWKFRKPRISYSGTARACGQWSFLPTRTAGRTHPGAKRVAHS